MKSIKAATLILAGLHFNSLAHAQLLIDEAREAKTSTDRIMRQLQIPTTSVDVYFPRSYVKAALDQMVVDLPKIETKVGELLNAHTTPALIELSIQTNSGTKLFKSCQNRIKTTVKIDGQDLDHNLVLIPAERGRIIRQNDEWLIEVTGSGPVALALEIPNRETLLSATSFEVVTQPLPKAILGRLGNLNSGNGTISSAELRAQTGLTLTASAEVEASCEAFAPFTITSYKMNFFSRTSTNSVVNTGASFSQARAFIQAARPGDQITFSQISLRHPDLTQAEFAPNFAIELR